MDLLTRPAPAATHRIPYGPDPSQFGDLWLPASPHPSKSPVVVFFHGGWWKSEYDLTYAGHLAAALAAAGIACWSLEYRRRGPTHGGYPNTFLDAATGLDHIASLAPTHPLDLSRVIAAGHSAGGHLVFWLAGRHNLPQPSTEAGAPYLASAMGERSNPLTETLLSLSPSPIRLRGVLSLAGAVDLRLTLALAGDVPFAHDRDEVHGLMQATPAEDPTRYALANPGDLLPFGIPQTLIQGTEDDQIPAELPTHWATQARAAGDRVTLHTLPAIDHLDIADPTTPAWPTVLAAIHQLLAPTL